MFMTAVRHMWIVIGHCCNVIAEIGNDYAVTNIKNKGSGPSRRGQRGERTLDTEVTSKVSVAQERR